MLRHCTKCDPDVIMLDKIPNCRTAETAVAASQEGHTLLAGVTIRSASLAVTRLVHMGAERDQLADELRLIVAQRLVKRLCAFCSDDGEPRGCSDCTNGYAGRVAVAETLEFTDDVVGAVQRSFMSESMIKPLNGYRVFEEHAAALIANKVTTHSEIERALGVAIPPVLLDQAAETAGGTATVTGPGFVRSGAAYNPSCPPEILERLSHDVHARHAVAQNANCVSGILDQFSRASDRYVRLHAAQHPNSPMRSLKRLLKDEDPEVLAAATAAVTQRLHRTTSA